MPMERKEWIPGCAIGFIFIGTLFITSREFYLLPYPRNKHAIFSLIILAFLSLLIVALFKLVSLLKITLAHNRELEEINFDLKNRMQRRRRAEKDLVVHTSKLMKVVQYDDLTRLYNRRTWLDKLTDEIQRAERYKYTSSVLMIDIDHFKTINDNYGHLIGDSVLKSIGQIIKYSIRTSDIAGRYGGEEFCIILPQHTLSEAHIVAEKLRKKIATEIFAHEEGIALHVTCSTGICQIGEKCSTPKEVLTIADSALYKAKESGRNCVAMA